MASPQPPTPSSEPSTPPLQLRYCGALQGLPVGLTVWRHGWKLEESFLPSDALVHICIAWAVGALMSFLSDTYRRRAPPRPPMLLSAEPRAAARAPPRCRWRRLVDGAAAADCSAIAGPVVFAG